MTRGHLPVDVLFAANEVATPPSVNEPVTVVNPTLPTVGRRAGQRGFGAACVAACVAAAAARLSTSVGRMTQYLDQREAC